MPIIEVNSNALLEAVRQLPAAELDAFIDKALSLRAEAKASTLSPEETQLIRRINRGLPTAVSRRYARLTARRKKGTLTDDEHRELLRLNHEAECRDADRAAALLELAKLRGVSVRMLMKQMGIQAPPVHGYRVSRK